MPSTLTVTGATNAEPIVITTSTPHGFIANEIVKISGVTGNTAANGTRHIKYLSATTFELTGSAGNGAYVDGGTCVGPLGSIAGIVGLISTELKALLVARGLPALSPDGDILLGSEYVAQNDAPPRIVFVPDTSEFGLGGAPKLGGTANRDTIRSSIERRRQMAERALMEETLHFRIHVWGQTAAADGGPSSLFDYDATRAIYHALIKVMHDTSVGVFTLTRGQWSASGVGTGPQMVVAGRELVFGAQWRTPVLDSAYDFAPADVAPDATNRLRPASGAADEVGCSG